MIKQISENGKQYWKSLDELSDTPGFQSWVEKEFPEGASLFEGQQRRGFIKLMAASFGLAGLGMTGCRRPEHTILPYGNSPEELIPGIPNYYATSMPTPQGFTPLIVESHNGRPTKVEGNPSYIANGGSTDIFAQASILDLYDPDRSKTSLQKIDENWEKVSKSEIKSKLKDSLSNGKVAILADKSFSTARNKIVDQLKASGVIWGEYESVDLCAAEYKLGISLGSEGGVRHLPNFGNASRILSLDSDFLGIREPNSLSNSKSFMKGRKVLSQKDAKNMNRLYSVESDLTLTGGVADHRLRLESSQISTFANLLAFEILTILKSKDSSLLSNLQKRGAKASSHSKWIKECAKDLCSKPKDSLIVIGSHLPSEVHALGYLINTQLGNSSKYLATKSSELNTLDLLKSAKTEKVDTFIFLGGNPVYSNPNIDWEEELKEIENKIHFGYSLTETSSICNYHVAQSHYLESWDEGLTWDGTSTVPTQPLISPLFDTISDIDFLLALSGSEENSHDFIRSLHEENSQNLTFNDYLRLGNKDTSSKSFIPNAQDKSPFNFTSSLSTAPSASNLEVLLVPDFHTWDGRFANNGWMHECPDPISKLTWDNALLISPVLAKILEEKYPDLNLLPKPTMLNKNGQIAPDSAVFDHGKQKAPVVTLTTQDGISVKGPIYVQPGLADFTVVASLGMGRKEVGRVGNGTGFDFHPLIGKDNNRIIENVSLEPTGDFFTLANVQEHWSMEGRAIVREANVEEYLSDESFAAHMGAESHSPKIWGKDQDADLAFKAQTTPRGNSSYEHPDHNYENSETPGLHQWGMTIDLNQCTGCSACVIACQSENNIPIVGKDQVLRGREMHWIRLDRYFSDSGRDKSELPSDVQVSFQGVACMHCETAPCETVCPVNATVHDEEGLNAMAYNRCVGTRYCANNCPYKVRRFNFFDWNKRKTDELYKGPLGEENDSLPSMGKNPDVTIRMRGVMEKCTYCVQRIQESKIQTKVKAQRNALLNTGKDGADIKLSKADIKVADGTIQTACQQVCPSDAIAFGDLSDPESEVSKLKNNPRDYSVLGYLNTRPRTTFLAKVRNPNPLMPDFSKSPHSALEYHEKAHPVHHDDHNGNGEVAH